MMKSWRLCIEIRITEIEFCCFFSQRWAVENAQKSLYSFILFSEFNINQERAKCKRIFHKYLFPSYTVPVKVQTQQPYQLRTYAWCWSIPPKCSRYKIQMKTVFKTEVNVLFVLYFLSATVCFDIGQRAERRGKTSSTLFRAKYPRLFVLYSGLVLCLIFQFRFQMIPKIRTVSECCRGFTRSSNGSSCVPICRWGNIFEIFSVYPLSNFMFPILLQWGWIMLFYGTI